LVFPTQLISNSPSENTQISLCILEWRYLRNASSDPLHVWF